MNEIWEIKAWQMYLLTACSLVNFFLMVIVGQVVHRPIEAVAPAPSSSATAKPTIRASIKPTTKTTPRATRTSRSYVRRQAPSAGNYQAHTPAMRYAAGIVDADQWPCLVKLWNRESGWSPRSRTGFHLGIAQLAGETSTDPFIQVDHGLAYIAHRYGSPCGAWAHSQAVGWY